MALSHRCAILLTALGAGVPATAQTNPTTALTAASLRSPAVWLARVEAEAASWPAGDRVFLDALLAGEYAKVADRPRFDAAVGRCEALIVTTTDVKARASARGYLAEAYARAGHYFKMEATLSAVDVEDALRSASGHLVEILADRRDFDRALRLAREGKNPSRRSDLLAVVAVAQAKAGRSSDYRATMHAAEAETAAAAALERPVDRSYYFVTLARAQEKAADFDRAEATAYALPPADGAAIHAAVALLRLNAGDRAGYERSVDRALEVAPHIESSVYAQSAYASIAKALARAGDEPRFRQALARATNAKGNLDVDYLLERAAMRAEAGDAARAQDLLKEAAAEAGQDDDVARVGRMLGLHQWNVMGKLAQAGNDAAALEVAAHLPPFVEGQPPPTPEQIYPLIAKAQAARGHFADALATMDRVPERGLRETNASPVAAAAGRAGESLTDVMRWIESFADPRQRANAYYAVAQGLIEAAETGTTKPTAGEY